MLEPEMLQEEEIIPFPFKAPREGKSRAIDIRVRDGRMISTPPKITIGRFLSNSLSPEVLLEELFQIV